MTVHNLFGPEEWEIDVCDYICVEMDLALTAQSLGRDQNELVQRMRAIPPETVMRYAATEFEFRLDGEDQLLRISKMPPDALTGRVRRQAVAGWALITGWNTRQLSLAESQARFRLLLDLLNQNRYETLPATARSPHGAWQAPGVLVIGISYELAKAFGRCFQQNAVVFGQAGAPVELLFL